MPKFAANLSMLFQEVEFLDRFALAAEAGFKYVEYLFPYEWSAELLAEHLARHQLQQVLFNLPAGNWLKGEWGIASLPGREHEFREGVDLAIHYAEKLKVKQLSCMAGLLPEHNIESLFPRHWETLVANVSYAARELQKHDIQLLLEPINSKIDMPLFLLDTLDKTLLLIKESAASNIRIQFDIYHMQIMQGDIIRSLSQHMDLIGHIQFADNPGCHEPGSGELNFSRIFTSLDELGYQGWVSAEYIPSGSTHDSLSWFTQA